MSHHFPQYLLDVHKSKAELHVNAKLTAQSTHGTTASNLLKELAREKPRIMFQSLKLYYSTHEASTSTAHFNPTTVRKLRMGRII